ncbi:hypothetical protein DdX_18693 [Ditylenchus destructor]|uniref:Uncharacterized protein n=1 Tax=Ditylenchus destructor TaxID=166010 RepID=A0AAD4MJ74_9BILA|nr:hypothetical protein DdX_18693 [Ditylenchus destructor]
MLSHIQEPESTREQKEQTRLKILTAINATFGILQNSFNNFGGQKELDTTKLEDILNKPCECSNSAYKDAITGHIITGDTNILNDKSVAYELSKGTKHRQCNTFTISKFRGMLYKYGSDIIERLATKDKDVSILGVKEQFIERLLNLGEQRWTAIIGNTYTLHNKIINDLGDVSDRFIITCIDKASSFLHYTVSYHIKSAMTDVSTAELLAQISQTSPGNATKESGSKEAQETVDQKSVRSGLKNQF